MRIFYVDYENVKDSGLNGIAKLDPDDVVRIYYSDDANKMTFGTHRRIIESSAKFEYVRMKQDLKGVKNALDVTLMNDMSARMTQERSADYYIVSADGDFDNYIMEKKKRKYSISKITEVCQASKTAEKAKQQAKPQPKQQPEQQPKQQPQQQAKPQPKQQPQKKKKKDPEVERREKEQAFRTHFKKYLKDGYAFHEDDILGAYMHANTQQDLKTNLRYSYSRDIVSDILERMQALIKNMPVK